MRTRPLRLILFDRTCGGERVPLGLSQIWRAGTWLYRGLGRLDHVNGVASWPEALSWLATVEHPLPIAEIQYWGHGKWGRPLIDKQGIGPAALEPSHPYHPLLCAVRQRLVPGRSLWWFRTCEAFGAVAGHDFARAWTRFFGCPAAGHTHIIAFFQSGLHLLRPGADPDWPVEEGLARGTPEHPLEARRSSPRAPRTITCLHGRVPADF